MYRNTEVEMTDSKNSIPSKVVFKHTSFFIFFSSTFYTLFTHRQAGILKISIKWMALSQNTYVHMETVETFKDENAKSNENGN